METADSTSRPALAALMDETRSARFFLLNNKSFLMEITHPHGGISRGPNESETMGNTCAAPHSSDLGYLEYTSDERRDLLVGGSPHGQSGHTSAKASEWVPLGRGGIGLGWVGENGDREVLMHQHHEEYPSSHEEYQMHMHRKASPLASMVVHGQCSCGRWTGKWGPGREGPYVRLHARTGLELARLLVCRCKQSRPRGRSSCPRSISTAHQWQTAARWSSTPRTAGCDPGILFSLAHHSWRRTA